MTFFQKKIAKNLFLKKKWQFKKKKKFFGNSFEKKVKFLAIFDSQMAIFRRVRFRDVTTQNLTDFIQQSICNVINACLTYTDFWTNALIENRDATMK